MRVGRGKIKIIFIIVHKNIYQIFLPPFIINHPPFFSLFHFLRFVQKSTTKQKHIPFFPNFYNVQNPFFM